MHHAARRLSWLLAGIVGCLGPAAQADTVGVDPRLPWIGYVNVFELPADPGQDRGPYVGGEGVAVGLVPAAFVGPTLVLGPNSAFAGGPPGAPFWWQPDGSGGFVPNKVLESNVYVDEGAGGVDLSGRTVRFVGDTLSQNLPPGYAAYAWIRDFAPGYVNLRGSATVQLLAGQPFLVTLDTSGDGLVQYGFAVVGRNADPAMLDRTRTVSVAAVPEPASVTLMLAGALAVLGLTRRRRAG